MRKAWIWGGLLVATGVGLRLAAAGMAFRADRGRLLPDEARYLDASSDLKGLLAEWKKPGGSPLPPGYPLWLGGLRGVHDSLGWLRLAGALLGAASCLTLIPLARGALPEGMGSRLGWWIAWGACLSPLCVASSAWLISESLYVPLLVLAGWGGTAGVRGRPEGAVLAGILLGVAQLVRPIALPLILLAAGWLLAASGRRAALAILLGAWIILLALGGLLGADRTARFCFPSGRVLGTLRLAWTSPTGSLVGVALPADPAVRVPVVSGWRERLLLASKKITGLWGPVPRTTQLNTGWPARLALAAWLLTMPAAAFGALAAARHWRTAGWLLILPIYTTLLHIAFGTSLRYRMPVEPALVCLAVWGYAVLWRRGLEREPPLG
jgi:hypothetical protein